MVLDNRLFQSVTYAKRILIGLTDDPSGQSVLAMYLIWLDTHLCVLRTCYCDDTQLGSRGCIALRYVSGACYEWEETCREGCIAPLFTQYKIENNVECL